MTEPTNTLAWRVIRVLTGRESEIASALLDADLAAYAPHEDARKRCAATKLHPDGTRDIRLCLLPGYVFVRCEDDDLDLVRDTDGVLASFTSGVPGLARVLSTDKADEPEMPSGNDVRVLYQLMDAERIGAFDRRPRRDNVIPFAEGELVQVALRQADPLIGEVIRSQTRSRRMTLLMDFFGSKREVDVGVDKASALCKA